MSAFPLKAQQDIECTRFSDEEEHIQNLLKDEKINKQSERLGVAIQI